MKLPKIPRRLIAAALTEDELICLGLRFGRTEAAARHMARMTLRGREIKKEARRQAVTWARVKAEKRRLRERV